MRILVDNGAYSLQNLGDVAMLQVMVRRLNRLDPVADIRVLTQAPDRLKRFCPGVTAVSTQWKGAWLESFNLIGPWRRLVPTFGQASLSQLERGTRTRWPDIAVRRLKRRFGRDSDVVRMAVAFREEVKRADWVIASGGGYINDSFSVHATGVLDTLALAQSDGRRTGMFGQGLGPINDVQLRRSTARVISQLTILSVRESVDSPALAYSLGRTKEKTLITGDDAIEIALDKVRPILGDRLGVNIRIAPYSGISHPVLRDIGSVIRNQHELRGTKIAYLPISLTEDWACRAEIATALGLDVDFCPCEGDEPTVDEVVEGVGQCRVVMTASYHTAIFALSQGIPVVALIASDYYRSKLRGAGEAFNGGLDLVDLRDAEWVTKLSTSLWHAWDLGSTQRSRLLDMARDQVNAGYRAYNLLAER